MDHLELVFAAALVLDVILGYRIYVFLKRRLSGILDAGRRMVLNFIYLRL